LAVNELPGADKFDDLVGLVKESFPDIHCLRCGYTSFHILRPTQQSSVLGEAAVEPILLPVVTLACRRCGHIEQHLSDKLQNRPIPIEVEKIAGS
jgi:ribosomal protein L37E